MSNEGEGEENRTGGCYRQRTDGTDESRSDAIVTYY